MDPSSHGFIQFGTTADNVSLYYTAPARMTSRDIYINLENWTHPNRPWVWVIDCANMELHHSITKLFVKIVEGRSAQLCRIVVLNPNVWMYGIMHRLRPEHLDMVWYSRSAEDLHYICTKLLVKSDAMMWLRLAMVTAPNSPLKHYDVASTPLRPVV